MERRVAPFTGAWIEIEVVVALGILQSMSHPSRVRGLKWGWGWKITHLYNVAPFTGAWIEILSAVLFSPLNGVAPFTGAWIEIPGTLPDRMFR